ncbi:MAG: choice-of-anchor D domain-containing protein, partial [Verrucomicrobiales bacterium]|nr:choice-of-anchor D domain-containing protein [Verrucomicrobiales bacterium]
VQVNAAATRTNIAASFGFSPSFVINNLMLCASSAGLFCQPIFPALDNATMGFGLGFPDFADAVVGGLEGRFSSPQAIGDFAKSGFDHMLANATFSIGYEINPFGFKLADAEARVILPNLTEHPARPGFAYVRPEDRGQNFPSRLTVALTALEQGFLANPLWKGTPDDLPLIFPQGSPERTKLQQAGLSFQKDYFPHGGILGAARLSLPKLIVDAPPATLNTLLDPAQDIFVRLGAAADVIGNYLLQTSEVGSLAFYVPAPNPPFFTDAQGNSLTPEKLLTAIQSFDVSSIGLQSLYPLEQFFFSGYMEGRLIGVPIARADIVAVPASASSGAFFRVSAGVPAESWLKSFVDSANMIFEIRQSPPVSIEQFFTELMENVNQLSLPGAQQAAVANLVNEAGIAVADALPKVSLDISVNNFRIPDPLTNLLASASASARLAAYSPRFNPSFVGEGPIAEVTRRGGVAFQGRFRFANLVTIDDAQLAAFPTDPVSLPGLAGRFRVAQLGIPGLALHDALFDFNSAPALGQPFLAASGAIDPIIINNPLNGQRLLSVMPLTATSTRIAAVFSMVKGAGNSVQGSFRIDPARIDMPLLGPGLSVLIHGLTNNVPSTNEAFSFSTTGPWGAAVSIAGQLSIRDLSNQEIARIGSSSGKFSASIAGHGLALTSLVISNFPTGLTVQTFPGTQFAQSFAIGGTSPAQLRINGDGTFSFTAALGGALNLPNLPTPALQAGASVTLTESLLSVTGSFQGGLLAPGVAANGTFTLTRAGQISLTGSATIPPQAFGSILIRGASTDNLTVQLFHDGYAVPGGARLQVVGVNSDLLTLSPFTNRANLDFTATVTSGNFTVPNFFRMSGGTMQFLRRSGVSTFEINTPSVTLLPGSPQENVLPAPFTKLIVSTDGQFYADTGERDLNLLGGLKLHGRLELGNQLGTAEPKLTISPASLNFGTIDFGTTSNKTVRFSNTGEAPLVVGLVSSSPSFLPAQNDLSIAVGEFRDVSVQFRPAAGGALNGQIQVFMNPGGQQPAVNLSGTARPVPIFDVPDTTVFFGDVPLGTTRTRTLVVRNLGVAPLVLTNASLSGPFTLSPAINNRILQPGERADLILSFTPAALGEAAGTLTIRANDNPTPHTITVDTGNAYAERLVRLREGGPTLRAIAM